MNKIYDPVDVNDAGAVHSALLACVQDHMAESGMADESAAWRLRESLNFAAVLVAVAVQGITYFYFLPYVRWSVLLLCVCYYTLTHLSGIIGHAMEDSLAVLALPAPGRPYVTRIEAAVVPDASRVRWTFSAYPHEQALKGASEQRMSYRYAGKYAALTFLGVATHACSFERGWGTYFTRNGELYVPQVIADVDFGLKGAYVALNNAAHAKQE